MAQVSKYDGLIHAKNGKIYDPTNNMAEVHTDLHSVNDNFIQMKDAEHVMSESRDDAFFERAYQRDLEKEAKADSGKKKQQLQ